MTEDTSLQSNLWILTALSCFVPLSSGLVDVDEKHQLAVVIMAATQTLVETIDQLDVGAVGLVKNDQPDVDEEDSGDEGQDLVDTNTSTKKKKKKKPKKKVSFRSC